MRLQKKLIPSEFKGYYNVSYEWVDDGLEERIKSVLPEYARREWERQEEEIDKMFQQHYDKMWKEWKENGGLERFKKEQSISKFPDHSPISPRSQSLCPHCDRPLAQPPRCVPG